MFLYCEKPGSVMETGRCLCDCVTPNLFLQNGDCCVRHSPKDGLLLLSLRLQWTGVSLLILQVQKLTSGVLRWLI